MGSPIDPDGPVFQWYANCLLTVWIIKNENAPALMHLLRICHSRFCHTDELTDRKKHGTDSITSTADTGGNNSAENERPLKTFGLDEPESILISATS